MKTDKQTANRKQRTIVVRLYGEECRRYHTDVVVEVPANVTDEQVENMWLRAFDGVTNLDWIYDCTNGIWPSNCGTRLQPEVRRDAKAQEKVKIRLVRRPRGSLIVESSGPLLSESHETRETKQPGDQKCVERK